MAHRRHDRLQLAPRELCAPYGARGGACSDPARRVLCEVAAHVDQSIDDAHVCRALHHSDQGHRYRALAGRHAHVPGEDDLCHCRSRVGDGVSHTTLAAVVALLQAFGLIKGELWSPDGPLAPSYARYQGCPYACEGCHAFRLDEAGRQAWRDPVRSGAQRLPLPCPLPEGVTQVREATAKKGNPTAPVVFLLASEDMADGAAARSDRQQGAPRLGLPAAEGPPGPLSVCHVSRGPQGEVRGNGPQVPADLEAQGGAHVDNHNPSKTASILGYVHRKPPDLHRALHLALPLGKATDPADAHADAAFLAQRTALALPVLPGQVHLGDAANDVLVPYRWMHDRGGIAVCDDNPRHEPLEPESLLPRGSDQYGTPSAPGGRVCHSNGEDYQAQSRQDVCGRQWPPAEPQRCPHRHGVRGYSHRRMCTAQPRLIGPIQRGPPAWQRLYEARSASERTNRYAQEVIANGRPLRMRGRKACRFAGAIRTLAQRLRRARTCARCHLSPRQGPRGSDLNDTAL